ncbi:MAG: tyrosine-type recombinase/integrase [Dehalococcoidia bacterium]|jgi:integrase/recombinase XerD
MKVYLEIEEVQQLENAATCPRDKLLIRVLSRLGCRISEALALQVSDIDFVRRTVTILHLKKRIRLSCPMCKASLGRRHQFCPECGDEVGEAMRRQQEQRHIRVLPVDKQTLDMLEDYIGRTPPTFADGSVPIFSLNRHRAWQIVRDCARRASLPDLLNPETGRVRGVSPHRLRDAFSVHAMKLDDSGDALRLLQEHLGHTSFNTTAKYRKVAGEEHRKWYEGLWSTKD